MKIYKKFCGGILLIIAIFIVVHALKQEKREAKSEYLIDIWIENKQDLDLKYIEMGIILDGKEEVINSLEGDYVKGKKMHFTINFSPETQFFLRGMSAERDIKPCYFDLKEYSDIQTEQNITFYIDNYEIYEY